MSVRVRFAPSPTGYLHIGGARTCLYNYLFAKKMGGKLILRIEDTDLDRSKKEFEESQINDLKWFGMDYDEGPGKEGSFGPYRQSERLDIYKKHAAELIESGKAFYCFCSDDELEQMREKAHAEGRDPLYEGPWRDFPLDKAKEKIKNGERPVIRFKVPKKDIEFTDLVRGKVNFPHGMVGDFVILRSNGMPTYNFCCVVDDALMNISHVIRGEDHLNNTLRQLMVYEACGFDIPEFAHVSLLVGEDRQKLSKRHGATSVTQYKDQGYLAEALGNYLCLLGWSHPDEKDIFKLDEIKDIFEINRFSKSSALYDIKKLNWVNGQHFRSMDAEDLLQFIEAQKDVSFFGDESSEWKREFVSLHVEKVQTINEFRTFYDNIYSSTLDVGESENEVLSWETTPTIKEFVQTEILKSNEHFMSSVEVSNWMEALKKEHKIKGKNLFMGLRVVLTGCCHGPDLKRLLPLTTRQIIIERLASI